MIFEGGIIKTTAYDYPQPFFVLHYPYNRHSGPDLSIMVWGERRTVWLDYWVDGCRLWDYGRGFWRYGGIDCLAF